MSTEESGISGIDTRVIQTETLKKDDLDKVHQLFDLSYRQANHSYLEKSLSKLRHLALATSGETPVGFALADTVKTQIPRLPEPQIVTLAGICCISPNYRRMGLFRKLEGLAASASGILLPVERRVLTCGRMAHPASFRTISRSPAVIPKYGVPLSDWQKEVGLRIAELYGINLDLETMVVIGEGVPIGYPIIEQEVTEEEWLPFEAVNRDRGDSLLGITWSPDAPEGW
ncbi:MAG: hypothetical protein JSV77_04660 [Dehalococcoidales bacterium]|nr:MAG: hypothetical protein JSV77_04660 [Dehalococcoidales bacterium]